jgi:hypothetical protein
MSEVVQIAEFVRVPQPDTFTLRIGASGTVQSWGFLPNGWLRHPMWVAWTHEDDTNRRAPVVPMPRVI